MTANVVLNNLRNIQETLLNTVTDIYQGRLDIHLLSLQQLQQQLNIISGQLQDEVSIPVTSGELRNLYHLLQVKARVRSSYLIVEISIPLTSKERYELDQIFSIPKKTGYVTASSEYIAFDMQRDSFIPLSSSDLQACIKYKDQEIICNIKSPIYSLKIDQSICDVRIITNNSNQTFCAITTSQCTDRWTKLQSANSWLYSCCEVCSVRILCPDGITSQHIQGSGIITINQQCTIKGDTFTITGHHEYQNTLEIQQDFYLPNISQLNHLINTTIPILNDWKIETKSHDEEFNSIQNKIDSIKAAEESDLSIHHVHHYSMIYVILFLVTISLIVGLYLYSRKVNKSSSRQENRSSPVHINMAVPAKPPRWRPQAPIPTSARSVDDLYSVVQHPAPVEPTRSEHRGAAVNFHIPSFANQDD